MFYYLRLRYRKRRCPHCGFHWTSVLDPNQPHFGRETIQCAACGKTIHTGWKEWPQFSKKERRKFLFGGWQAAVFVCGAGILLSVFGGNWDAAVLRIWFGFWIVLAGLVVSQRGLRIALSKRRFQRTMVESGT
jgi:hypothetical protein